VIESVIDVRNTFTQGPVPYRIVAPISVQQFNKSVQREQQSSLNDVCYKSARLVGEPRIFPYAPAK
jgi:hypothetical protein